MNFIKNNANKVAYWCVSLFAIVYAFRFGFLAGLMQDIDGALLSIVIIFANFLGYLLLNQYFRNLNKGTKKDSFLKFGALLLGICNVISFVGVLLSIDQYRANGIMYLAVFDIIFILAQAAAFILIFYNKMNGNAMIHILKLCLLVLIVFSVVVGLITTVNLLDTLSMIEQQYKFYTIVNALPTILAVFLFGGLYVFYAFSGDAN